MRLIFDFDYTLFRTRKLYQAIEEFYLSQGIPSEVFVATIEASRGNGRDWKPDVQLHLLAESHSLNVEVCKEGIHGAIQRSTDFFYEDSIPCLRALRKDHQLFLVTYGEDSFQNAKIESANISQFFDKTIITQDIAKVSALRTIISDKGEDAMFIEDNPLALIESKKAFPNLRTVRINRGEGRYAKEPDDPSFNFVIENLFQLQNLLKS